MTLPNRLCYLNGAFLPLDQARVSVLDRGFIFGDAVYEVIIAIGGRVFALPEHLDRLERSLAAVGIASSLGREQWQAVIERLVEANGGGDQSIYLQVTRGVAERDHGFPTGITPTVFAMSKPLEVKPGPLQVDAIVLADNRWLRCDIKATSLLPNVLLRNQALAVGAYEAILVRGETEVTEGSSSNVLVVNDTVVTTPPLSNLILPGVTRNLMIEVARSTGLEVREASVTLGMLREAHEIWLTSTTRDLSAVKRLDGVTVGRDGEYPLAAQVFQAFQEYRRSRAG